MRRWLVPIVPDVARQGRNSFRGLAAKVDPVTEQPGPTAQGTLVRFWHHKTGCRAGQARHPRTWVRDASRRDTSYCHGWGSPRSCVPSRRLTGEQGRPALGGYHPPQRARERKHDDFTGCLDRG
jgi:hypothetical protein